MVTIKTEILPFTFSVTGVLALVFLFEVPAENNVVFQFFQVLAVGVFTTKLSAVVTLRVKHNVLVTTRINHNILVRGSFG